VFSFAGELLSYPGNGVRANWPNGRRAGGTRLAHLGSGRAGRLLSLRAGERRRSGVQAGAAGGEVVAFGGVAGEHQGLVVGEAGLAGAVEPAQVFRAGGGQVVVAGQLRLGGEGGRRWSSGRC